ncbi:MAG: DUF4132 domain-containing protein [Myxococcota bacterium]
MVALPNEETLKIPESWRPHLEGRAHGPLDLAEVEKLVSGEWDFGAVSDFQRFHEDLVDAPYVLVEYYGEAALEPLTEALAAIGGYVEPDVQRAAAEAISIIPTDDAYRALLERATQSVAHANPHLARFEPYYGGALREASNRFPRRAIRLLAETAATSGAERYETLLGRVVRQHLDVATEVVSTLAEPARDRVESAIAGAAQPKASLDELPEVLASPPWTRPKPKKKKPKALTLEPLPVETAMAWRPDEREAWAKQRGGWSPAVFSEQDFLALKTTDDWAALGKKRAKGFQSYGATSVEQVARKWGRRAAEGAMRSLVARFELGALDFAISFAYESPKDGYAHLGPFVGPEVANAVAFGLSKHKSAKAASEKWLRRHPEAAAKVFIPQALGADRGVAGRACLALRYLYEGDHRPIVEAVAERYGPSVPAATAALFGGDELMRLPRKLPAFPAFWAAEAMIAPTLLASRKSLPPPAIDSLATMLAISKPGAVYAGVRQVQAACDPASMARFAWSLFEAWLAGGAPPKEKWAFYQLGWLGDDDVAYRLARLMEGWPRQGAAKRAELGLDVLAEMKRDVALVLVSRMAQKSRARSLRKNAKKKLTAIAESLDIGEDDLADRLVPTFGLDAKGGLDLDYGPRSFRIEFDEALKPFILEGEKRRKSLPKPGKNDDPELATASEARFKQLKKNVRTVARSEIGRLESAMGRRRWSRESFSKYIAGHPLMSIFARSLLWAEFDGPSRGRLFCLHASNAGASNTGASNTGASNTGASNAGARYVNAEGMPLELTGDVGLVHRVELSEEETSVWGEVFAQGQRTPPFLQLDRPFYAPENREELVIEVLDDEVPAGALVGLTGRGWERGDVGDGAHIDRMVRRFDGFRVDLIFEPGITAGLVGQEGSQELSSLRVYEGAEESSVEALEAPMFSELMLDITRLS